MKLMEQFVAQKMHNEQFDTRTTISITLNRRVFSFILSRLSADRKIVKRFVDSLELLFSSYVSSFRWLCRLRLSPCSAPKITDASEYLELTRNDATIAHRTWVVTNSATHFPNNWRDLQTSLMVQLILLRPIARDLIIILHHLCINWKKELVAH